MPTATADWIASINGIIDLNIVQAPQRKNIKMKNPQTENRNNSYGHHQPKITSLEMNPKSMSNLTDITSRKTTSFLLGILTNEIKRDGGACLVATLKDYIIDGNGHREPLKVRSLPYSSSSSSKERSECCNKSKKRRNQQLNSLLIHSNVGKPKLLAFLESHPNVFHVNRSVIPHWVQLVTTLAMPVKTPSSSSDINLIKQVASSRVNGQITDLYPLRENLRAKLFQKALYVLRKRKARIDRRKKNNSSNTLLAADSNISAPDTNDTSDSGVYCHWLLRQCSWELHFLLRYCGFYQDPTLCGYETPSDVKQVGSRGWEDVTLPIFELLLRTGKDNTSCNKSGGQLVIISWILVRAGKASLRQSCSDEEYQRQLDTDGNNYDTKIDFIVRSSATAEEGDRLKGCEEKKEGIRKNRDNDEDEDDAMLSLVRRIDKILTEIVCRKDGGHQVSLQLLLHRYPHFKDLLGGRDLWTLYCDFSDYENDENDNKNTEKNSENPRVVFFFQSISMFHNGANLILRSKRSKTIECDVGNDDCIKKDSRREQRMKVDEEGLYSVTNNKWGRAMSNLVIQACHQTNLFGEQDSAARVNDHEQEGQEDGGVDPSSTSIIRTVIDLTASVGGMTLALAKSNFFDRVLALEIEQCRADLCRENLSRHGFHDVHSSTNGGRRIVEIRHQDSIKQIPFLPRRACFVIDPPWGGYDYKEKVRRQQQQGKQLLKLGDTPLEDVLAMISHHNSPCVVGLRLPTNFAVENFLNALRENDGNVEFECLTRRKISVQLFVVLYFPPSAVFRTL